MEAITSKRKASTKTTTHSRSRRMGLDANSMSKITFAGNLDQISFGTFDLGHLGFWDRALTEKEIQHIYKGGPTIRKKDSLCCMEKSGISHSKYNHGAID